MQQNANKPFLRWAGSKKKLLPKLSPYWNPARHQRYVEPFMVPALNPFERNIMLGGFKVNAPAAFFDSVIGMLKEHMTELEHSQMVARLS